MKNQDLIELNELNKESQGGTELTTKNLFDRLDREELENVQIIHGLNLQRKICLIV